MPDTSLQITPPPSPSSLNIPDTGMPKLDLLDTAQHRMDVSNLGESSDDYARSLGDNKQTITDLINDVNTLQAEGANLLKNYGGVPNAPSPGGFNPEKGYQELAAKLNPTEKTLQATNTPMTLGTTDDFARYKDSRNFQTFGYTPNLGEEQEFKYGRAMTWDDTIANAWGGGKVLAANTFIEGWKGWGRMASALSNWDASKLMGSEEERYKMAEEQNAIMNRYAMYDTETSKDSIWNRQFFGTMLQQSGFAVGAALQFAVEEFLTAGLATGFEAVAGGLMLARTAKTLEKASELANATRKVMGTITKQPKVENAFLNGVKTLLPGYKSVQELSKLHKAGAGFAQMAFTGLGGIRRGFSEFNMARSESIFEAASTYKQLQDRLVNEYTQEHGVPPEGEDLERIKQTAEDASHDNFVTNVGVLSVMNRFQFDAMTKQFSKARRLVNVGESELADEAFSVTGKIAGKNATRAYEKGFLGRFNAVGDIAKDFGKRKAAWEATKSIGRGLSKFEGLEGAQELLQNASDKGLEDYYYDLYHGKKGYGDRMDAVLANIQNPITDIDGMKTFLMGALTGRLIAPMSSAFGSISTKIGDARKLKENPDYKNGKQRVKEAVGLLNHLYQDPAWFKKEALASIKINNKAAETMEEAAKNHNRYVFNNHKDSAFAAGVAAAVKLDMYDSLKDSIKEMGSEMDDKQFKEAFGIDLTEGNKGSVKQLTDEMIAQADDYYNTFNILKDKYSDLVVPELYKNNKGDSYFKAKLAKAALDASIDIIASNSYKAKQAIKRASLLQTQISSNKNIGPSSLQVLTTMGSEQALKEHIRVIEEEVAVLKTPGAKLTPEQKEVLKSREEELHLAKTWQSSYDEIMGNDSAEYSPTAEGRAYNSFAQLINLFNKRSKNYTTVSKEDVDDNFIKLTDYIKLNRDNKEYVDAMNLLADPFNMKLVSQAHMSAMQAAAKKFQEEHKEELEKETGISTKEPPKHTIVKEEDGTWTIKSPDGSDAKTGFATEEEAMAEKAKMDAVLAEEFAKEEEKTKAAAAAKTSQVITDPSSVKVGDFIISDSGVMYEITGIIPDTGIQWRNVKDATTGEWSKEQFEEFIKEGRFTREVAPDTTGLTGLFTGGMGDTFWTSALDSLKNGKASEAIFEDAIQLYKDGKIKTIDDLKQYYADKKAGRVPFSSTPADGGTSTAKELIDEINAIELTNEAYNVVEEKFNQNLDSFTDEEYDEIKALLNKKYDDMLEAEKIAKAAGTKKFLLDTDPEFLNLYIPATKKIADLVNNNPTVAQITAAFHELGSILIKLDPSIKSEYISKHTTERDDIINKIQANAKANDIASVKAEITKALSGDDVSLDMTVESLFDVLNIDLSPELKEEAIQHFEAEYIKAIDKKIAKLNSLINDSGATPVLSRILEDSLKFKTEIEGSLEIFKKKSDDLNNVRNGFNFAVPENRNYDNDVHRSILDSGDGDSTIGQAIAITNLTKAGLLVPSDIDVYDEDSRHGASQLINMGIGRMFTLQINKLVQDFYKTGKSDDLVAVWLKYLKESDLSQPRLSEEELTEQINAALADKDNYKTADEFIKGETNIPVLGEEIDVAQYKALNDYRNTISKLMADTNALDFLKHLEKRQQQDLNRAEPFDIKTSFTHDDAKLFQKYLEDYKKLTEFRTQLLSVYENVKKATTPKEATKLINELANKYTSKNYYKKQDAAKLLSAIFGSLLQTESLLNTDNDASEPLTEEQMEIILDKPDQSLNKSQIIQIEEFAKTEKLEKIKKKFHAAVGHSPETLTFTPAGTAIKIDPIAFSSLRQKNASDTRTSEDLALKLMPDENGIISTKKALDLIVRSKYSTTAEKQLAQKLLAAVREEDTIKVDNSMEFPGDFDPDTNEVFINLDRVGYKENKASAPIETVILHELMHSVIETTISDPKSEYAKKIKELYTLVKGKEGAKTFYAYQDGMSEDEKLREFVTEAFTNPAFQYLLVSTPISKTSKETVWDRLMTFLSNILKKFGIDMDSTVLAEVMSITNELFNKNDILPSERIMEQIKNAGTEEELNAILDSLDKTDYSKAMYNSLVSSIKHKVDSVNAIKLKELTSKMSNIKVNKTTYYYTTNNGQIDIYKKVKYKLSKIKKAETIAAVKAEIAKRNPPPPPTDVTDTSSPFTIESDLKSQKFQEDLSALEFNKVSAAISKTAVEKNPLRSTSYDGTVDEVSGEYVEEPFFAKYYHKVRDIINVLSTAAPEKLAGKFVTLVKDDASLRWDGSPEDEGWQKATKGVIGYISDENGNPIVFDKQGNAIGRADKNDPGSSKYNTGENQIVYFNIVKKDTGGDPADQAKITSAREAVMNGQPQIAHIQKISQGQMALKGLVSPISINQKNTARDKDIQDMIGQDHVNLELNGQYLNAVITAADGAINRTALFPPRSGSVKIKTPSGGTYTMFDHLVELMKVYHELEASGDDRIGDIKTKLVDFAYHMWLTGDTQSEKIRRSLKIPQHFNSLDISRYDPKLDKYITKYLKLFDVVNGVKTINENNVKIAKAHIDNMKINIDKGWLEKGVFNFPYITEKDGKKMINFEQKNYREFLVKDVGLITYINDIPVQDNIKRYSSIVHFLEPRPLNNKPSGITVTQKEIVEDPNAINTAIKNAGNKVTPPSTKKVVPKTNNKRRFHAVSFQTEQTKNYEKICK